MHTHTDTYCVRHEACPKCRELGNDRSGNNLGVYSDGHTYCFRCGHGSRRKNLTQPSNPPTTQIVLPNDITQEFPNEAKQWLEQYSLSRLDIQTHHIMWSDKWSRIIFPYFDSTGLLAWQGRYIPHGKNQIELNGKAPAKWFSQGKIHEILHPINVTKDVAILVEDIVSAIKVSKYVGAIPIFGSTISAKHFLRIKHLVHTVGIWLDPDMKAKSIKLASLANILGLKTHIILSDKDPKEESNEIIQSSTKILDHL